MCRRTVPRFNPRIPLASRPLPAVPRKRRPRRPLTVGRLDRPPPGPGNTVVPLFCKPFSGECSIFAFFDHDLPLVFNDFNGYQLTWWGLKVVPENADGHPGYDWIVPEGTPVLAVAAGMVTAAGVTPPFRCPDGRETVDNAVTIEHQANAPSETLRVRSDYDHLSRIDAQVGQLVKPGDQIGLSGNPSCSGSPHLHFQANVFVKGRFIQIDPYGWEGPAPDPWAQDPRGAPSLWLWQDGQAPAISYREVDLPPNPRGPPGAPVAITYVRWLAANDDQNPNNEFVELTLDSRYASAGTYDLSRYALRNNRGDTFTFPDGFRMQQGLVARIYVGSGQNSSTELYWGRVSGVFDPMGDCIRLQRFDGATTYRIGATTGACN